MFLVNHPIKAKPAKRTSLGYYVLLLFPPFCLFFTLLCIPLFFYFSPWSSISQFVSFIDYFSWPPVIPLLTSEVQSKDTFLYSYTPSNRQVRLLERFLQCHKWCLLNFELQNRVTHKKKYGNETELLHAETSDSFRWQLQLSVSFTGSANYWEWMTAIW